MCCEGCVECCDVVSEAACCAPAAGAPGAEVWWALAVVGGAAGLALCCAALCAFGNVIGDGGVNGLGLDQLSDDVADPWPGEYFAGIRCPPCPAFGQGGSIWGGAYVGAVCELLYSSFPLTYLRNGSPGCFGGAIGAAVGGCLSGGGNGICII